MVAERSSNFKTQIVFQSVVCSAITESNSSFEAISSPPNASSVLIKSLLHQGFS
jgi:hypothetical protein